MRRQVLLIYGYFHNTGKEMAWLGLAVVVLVVLGSRDLDPTNDEINW